MIFQRKIYEKMLEWKSSFRGESALLIEGARRVGKSTVAEAFAQNEYQEYLVLDFARESAEVKRNFEENMGDLDNFFRNLFLLKGKELPRGASLIIFDEVQMFPLARQAVKYLVQDGRYDYIETGSLISIRKNVKDILIPSEEYRLRMYPMDFEEFLWAQGDTVTGQAIREAYKNQKPLGDGIHRKIMQRFRTYMAVGGMPQAVEAFVAGKSYQEIDLVKRNILRLYEEDLRKSDAETGGRTSAVFRAIPEQLSNHRAHFKYAAIEKGTRFYQYMESIDFIAESMMGNVCLSVTEPAGSLELFTDRSNFKLFLGDTGLLVTQIMQNRAETDDDLYKSIIFDKLGTNQGMVMENLVAQMLKCKGYDLYFHTFKYRPAGAEREKNYEVDFLLVRGRRICPVEVKSSGYTNHKSFDYFLEKYPIKVNQRVIIYTKDLKKEGDLLFVPLYMTMCL